mmetsp:Transcript_26186/g.79543  ORF Transcript_26186/g.79543 Transcript_26186/m.79543 type:complete len:143 (-) Transcript_26186:210-638(-)
MLDAAGRCDPSLRFPRGTQTSEVQPVRPCVLRYPQFMSLLSRTMLLFKPSNGVRRSHVQWQSESTPRCGSTDAGKSMEHPYLHAGPFKDFTCILVALVPPPGHYNALQTFPLSRTLFLHPYICDATPSTVVPFIQSISTPFR